MTFYVGRFSIGHFIGYIHDIVYLGKFSIGYFIGLMKGNKKIPIIPN